LEGLRGGFVMLAIHQQCLEKQFAQIDYLPAVVD